MTDKEFREAVLKELKEIRAEVKPLLEERDHRDWLVALAASGARVVLTILAIIGGLIGILRGCIDVEPLIHRLDGDHPNKTQAIAALCSVNSFRELLRRLKEVHIP